MSYEFATNFKKVPNESEDSIIRNVNLLISYLDLLLEQDYGSGDLKKFVNEILNYLKKLLNRFRSNLDEEIDYHSWIARNTYELFVLTKYGLQSHEKVSEVILTAVDDYRDIRKKLFKDSEPVEEDVDRVEFLSSMEKLDSIIDEHEIDIEKWKSTGQMANETDLNFEHGIIFKLTSKYVHPTSLFLFGNKNFVQGKDSKKAIFSSTQWYAAKLITYMPNRIEELKSAT